MQQVDEAIATYILEKELEAVETGQNIKIFTDYLTAEEITQLPQSVQDEINYIREKLAGTDVTAGLPSNYSYTVEIGEGKNICRLPAELLNGKEEAYIYDEQSASVYKVEPTIIWGVEMHGYEYGNLLVTQTGLLERAQNSKENEEITTQLDIDYQMISKLEDGTYIIELIITSNKEISSVQIEGIEDVIVEKKEEETTIQFNGTENTQYNVNITMANAEKISRVVNIDIYKILIRSVAELEAFREDVNNGNSYEGIVVELKEDLDLSEVYGAGLQSWTPIGNYGVTSTLIFSGIFEGNNHTISNLYISGATTEGQGLFGKNGGTIQNLTLEDVNISTDSGYTGGLLGYNDTTGSVSNITTSGTITTTKYYTGGVIGTNCGNITGAVNKVNIPNSMGIVGGIVGYNYTGTVDNCINIGKIYGSNIGIGGICGMSQQKATVQNCYNTGTVDSAGKDSYNHCNTGGIVGGHVGNSKIIACYNTGNITGVYEYVGGIVGYNGNSSSGTQTVTNVYNTGIIKGYSKTASSNIGDSVGYLIGRYGSLSGKYGNTNQSAMSLWSSEEIITNLSDAFVNDVQNEDGTWKYNDGYPILKWQLEELEAE